MMVEVSETDRIEQNLARTRARMDGRLDELQDHLTPKRMLNDAFAYFQGGDGAEFTNDLVTRAKANPIPVALAGIGIAWLMASGSGSAPVRAQPPRSDDLVARIRRAEGSVERYDHDDDDSYAGRLDDARAKVVGVARQASDTGASYAQRIKDAVATATQSVRRGSHDFTSGAGETLGRIGDGAAEHGATLKEGTQDMARSTRDVLSSVAANPFALGAAAALVGVIAGALIPTSNEEEAALGGVATKVRTAGRDLAQDVVDRGGRIANETLEAVKGSAEAHGLSTDKPVGDLIADVKSGDLVGSVKQVAQDALQAGKDSTRTHLAGAEADAERQPG